MIDETTADSITCPVPLVLWAFGERRLELRSLGGERFAVLVEGETACGFYRLPTRRVGDPS